MNVYRLRKTMRPKIKIRICRNCGVVNVPMKKGFISEREELESI
jgi:hypothetical protein